MANKSQRVLQAILLALLLTTVSLMPASAQNDSQPVVRAVLFYSPACPHCEEIIQNYLPPILEQYGDQLKIVAINVTLPEGQELYQATVDHFQIEDSRQGVPTLIVADVVMVGQGEIPAQFPGLITDGLAKGGIDWPEVPGLAEVVGSVKSSSTNPQTTGTSESNINADTPPMFAKFLLDPVANSIAVVVLIIMVASIIGVVISFTKPIPEKDFWPKWVIPVLSVLGIGVAFYLTYVETSGAEAFCGPVGDCNTVQLSPYATLFGVLHVGLIGIIGYALIFVGWALYTFGPQSFRWVAAISVWGMAFFGVLFSIYLTFLEPFVIGATCMWCISSAILMTLVFIAATGPAKRAWKEDDFDDEDFKEDEQEAIESEYAPKEEMPLMDEEVSNTEGKATTNTVASENDPIQVDESLADKAEDDTIDDNKPES